MLPGILLTVRIAAGIGMLAGARYNLPAWWFLTLLTVGVLSDVVDGVLARRFGLVTARLRALDSAVDGWFFFCALISAWVVHRDALRGFAAPLGALLVVYAGSLAVAVVKFGRLPAYHAHSARVAGGLFFLAGAQLFGFGEVHWLLWAAIGAALVSHIERAVITLVLPTWQHDVRSVWHALRMRAQHTRPSL